MKATRPRTNVTETLESRNLTAKAAHDPRSSIEQITGATEAVVQFYEGGHML